MKKSKPIGSEGLILFVNPPFGVSIASSEPGKRRITSVPLGILCIASSLKKKGYNVKVIDGLTNANYYDEVKSLIPKCMCVGITMKTAQVPAAYDLLQMIKRKNRDMPTVVGGVHATLHPEQTCSDELIDYVIRDEGEVAMHELLRVLEGKKKIDSVHNITYKDKNGMIKSNPRGQWLKGEEIPVIDFSLIEKAVRDNIDMIPIHSSRGCPGKCTFCINKIRGDYWRFKKPEVVLSEIENARRAFKTNYIRFWDENFFVLKSRVEEIAKSMIERKYNMEWETTIRCDYFKKGNVDDVFLKLIKKSGCFKLCFGAESGSQKILDMLKKQVTVEMIKHSARQCTKHNIWPQYSFMCGLPNETHEDMMRTLYLIDDLKKINKDVEIFGPQKFRPFPGGELYAECRKHGWKDPQSLKEWAEYMRKDWTYLKAKDFPWIKEPDFVESIESYVSFGANPVKVSLDSSVNANILLKLVYIVISKIRWKLKFFKWPIEFKIASWFLDKLSNIKS